MSQLGDLLRETTNRPGNGRAIIMGLVDDRTDAGDRARNRWRTLRQRLRLDGVGCCCGPSRSFRQSTTIAVENDEQNQLDVGSGPDQDPDCLTLTTPGGATNLAEALAAERYAPGESVVGTQPQVTLMRLLAETNGCDGATWLGMGSETMCCVCMGREKGAACIPCGHTFCRVCSREIWMNRGTCALCNRPIFDVLDLY